MYIYAIRTVVILKEPFGNGYEPPLLEWDAVDIRKYAVRRGRRYAGYLPLVLIGSSTQTTRTYGQHITQLWNCLGILDQPIM